MANTWKLYITIAPDPACAPFSQNNVSMSYTVTGDGCAGTNYASCAGIVDFGNSCSDAPIQTFIDQMINYFKTNSIYNPLMTYADTIYVNDNLYLPLPVGATNYIEYDFSFLPQAFLDLIASNIVDLSTWLGTHLPMPNNIQWMGAAYIAGRFRVYVAYTPPTGGVMSMDLPAMTLSAFAGIIAGLIVFAIAQRLTSIAGPLYSTIIGATLGIIAALTLSYIIYDVASGISTAGTAPPQTPADKSKNIDDYIKNYIIPFCNNQYPGCVAVPATCDAPTYRAYAACTQRISQCAYDAALRGDPVTTCDPRVQEYQAIDTGLANGTMPVADAQTRTITNNTTIKNYHDSVVAAMTCPSGQTYDTQKQKCIADCWIPGPTGCILTANTGKTIAVVGALTVTAIIAISLMKSRKK